MAGTRPQPDFQKFAALQSEPAKGSLDPNRKHAPEPAESATEKPKRLTISQYQDPRDQLDHERHTMRAKLRQETGEIGYDPPDAK